MGLNSQHNTGLLLCAQEREGEREGRGREGGEGKGKDVGRKEEGRGKDSKQRFKDMHVQMYQHTLMSCCSSSLNKFRSPNLCKHCGRYF